MFETSLTALVFETSSTALVFHRNVLYFLLLLLLFNLLSMLVSATNLAVMKHDSLRPS